VPDYYAGGYEVYFHFDPLLTTWNFVKILVVEDMELSSLHQLNPAQPFLSKFSLA
jgi:hypothetical protein